jgi:hypothetical protein
MRVRLKGINSYTARLADGTLRTYWYAWKGGPRLRGEPGDPEFHASYNDAVAQKVKTPSGRLPFLLQSYQGSEDFRQLAPRTREDYGRIIQKEIERRFSDFPLSAMTDRRARGIFMTGAISSPGNRVAKPIMHGSYSPASCRGRKTAGTSRRIHASVAGASIEDHGRRRFGHPKTRRGFSAEPRNTCSYRFCWRSGRDNARAICCGYPGRPMVGLTFA